jgi:hypothetical protein
MSVEAMTSNLLRRLVLSSVLLGSGAATAQVVTVQVPVPTVRFAVAPPLVLVTPGIQVVEDHDDEIFYVDGWYWMWWNDRWYRSRDHLGGWVFVERRVVPAHLFALPRGKYKHFKRQHGHGGGGGHPGGHGGHGGHGGGKKHHGGRGKGKH